VDVIGGAVGRIGRRPLEHAQRSALECHEIVEAAAEVDGDPPLHFDHLRRARTVLEHAGLDLDGSIAGPDQQARSIRHHLAYATDHLAQLRLVVLDGGVVAALVGAVGEHDQVGSTPRELVAVGLVVPQELRAGAGAVDAQGVDDHAGALTLHGDAEDAHGTGAVRAHLEAVGAVGDVEGGVGVAGRVRAGAHAALALTVDEDVEGAAVRLVEIIEVEEADLLTDVARIRGGHAAEGARPIRLDVDARDAEAILVAAVSADVMGLPAGAVALDAHSVLTVAAPGLDRQHEAVTGVAEASLELTAQVAGVEIAGGVGGTPEEQARLTLAASRAREGRVQLIHRVSVRVLDADGQAEGILRQVGRVQEPPALITGDHHRCPGVRRGEVRAGVRRRDGEGRGSAAGRRHHGMGGVARGDPVGTGKARQHAATQEQGRQG